TRPARRLDRGRRVRAGRRARLGRREFARERDGRARRRLRDDGAHDVARAVPRARRDPGPGPARRRDGDAVRDGAHAPRITGLLAAPGRQPLARPPAFRAGGPANSFILGTPRRLRTDAPRQTASRNFAPWPENRKSTRTS